MTTAGAEGCPWIFRRNRSKLRVFSRGPWSCVSISEPSLAMNSTNTRSAVALRNLGGGVIDYN